MNATKPIYDLSTMTREELIALVASLLHKIEALEKIVTDQKEEIAHLKGLKGRPRIKPNKPSGMEESTKKGDDGGNEASPKARKGRTSTQAKLAVSEVITIPAVDVPEGSRFKGYEELCRAGF